MVPWGHRLDEEYTVSVPIQADWTLCLPVLCASPQITRTLCLPKGPVSACCPLICCDGLC